jgi:hypothetical protein
MSRPNCQNPKSSRIRSAVSLNRALDHKLFGYVAAASAAGVSVLALAPAGQAEIVFTPTNQLITTRTTLSLDLNNDGVTDFTLRNIFEGCIETSNARRAPECSEFTFQSLYARGNGSNAVVTGTVSALALPVRTKVGPEDKFGVQGSLEFCTTQNGNSQHDGGPWLNVKNLYLGLQFTIDGQIHYGWARLTLSTNKTTCVTKALLTGYAYETEPNTPITTGKLSGEDEVGAVERPEATLGTLALGSVGLETWRQEGGPNKARCES